MSPRAILRSVTFWPGVASLVVASILLVRSRLGPGGSGWEDLAAFAGALIVSLGAGVAFGAFLWLADARTPAWQLVVARIGAGVGIMAGVGIAAASSAAQWRLLLAVAFVILAAVTGLVVSARARRPARGA